MAAARDYILSIDFLAHFYDVPFGCHLGELGRCQRAYDALITRWRRVLLAGVMIEIEHEELVDACETNVRRMLAHCGLE
ncbi:sulfotransferase [Paraburkholderia sp. MM5482-R1]|uniref:sulfotransferase n=1 Tax=unclassified Paraburkholderia TaxID=2615204 RepID=UPI003D19E0AA